MNNFRRIRPKLDEIFNVGVFTKKEKYYLEEKVNSFKLYLKNKQWEKIFEQFEYFTERELFDLSLYIINNCEGSERILSFIILANTDFNNSHPFVQKEIANLCTAHLSNSNSQIKHLSLLSLINLTNKMHILSEELETPLTEEQLQEITIDILNGNNTEIDLGRMYKKYNLIFEGVKSKINLIRDYDLNGTLRKTIEKNKGGLAFI